MTETQSGGGLSVGDVVADRYRIEAILGEGGMGVVYRAEHLHLRKPFALKVLLPEWTSSPEIVARFEREAVAAGNIQSPHVAAATDFGRLPQGTFFLVMEYVEGRTLRSVLDAGAFDAARALHVARGIAAGLHAAHVAGVVHRDMKPENVMLVERDGDPDFVKLLDFGIAKVEHAFGAHSPAPSNPLTRMGSVMGTPDYMSPEQALGQPVDARTDQYALGIMLFEMLTGNRPFEGDAVSVLRQRVMSPPPELPGALTAGGDSRVGAVVRRLLATAPENRFATVAEVVTSIDECAWRGAQIVVKAPPPPDSTPALTTPVATRVRQSLLAGLGTLRAEARLVLANPASLLRERRGVLVSSIVAFVFVVGIFAMLVMRSGAPPEHASPATTATPAMAPGSPSPTAPTDQPEAVADLPPPPAPSSSGRSSPGRPAPSQSASHRTGPGGIYIPPPSQWFK